jgi:predicted RNA-binding protein
MFYNEKLSRVLEVNKAYIFSKLIQQGSTFYKNSNINYELKTVLNSILGDTRIATIVVVEKHLEMNDAIQSAHGNQKAKNKNKHHFPNLPLVFRFGSP